MKNKAFSLIELMGTMVMILAIVILIGLGYQVFSGRPTPKQTREQLLINITDQLKIQNDLLSHFY